MVILKGIKCPKCNVPMQYNSKITDDVVYECPECGATLSYTNSALDMNAETGADFIPELLTATVWRSTNKNQFKLTEEDLIIHSSVATKNTQDTLKDANITPMIIDGVLTLGFVERLEADQILRRTGEFEKYNLPKLDFFDMYDYIAYRKECSIETVRYEYAMSKAVIKDVDNVILHEVNRCIRALLCPTLEEAALTLAGIDIGVSTPDDAISVFCITRSSSNVLREYGDLNMSNMQRKLLAYLQGNGLKEIKSPQRQLLRSKRFLNNHYVNACWYVTPRFLLADLSDLSNLENSHVMQRITTTKLMAQKMYPDRELERIVNKCKRAFDYDTGYDYDIFWSLIEEELEKKIN